MGFAFQVIKVGPECLATSTVPLRSILRTMIFCPFRLSPWSPWLIKFEILRLHRDWWWCIVWRLIPQFDAPFDLCIWWRWSDTTFGYPGPGVIFSFFGHFSVYLFSTELLFVSSYPNIIGLWHFTWLLYSFHHFPVISLFIFDLFS